MGFWETLLISLITGGIGGYLAGLHKYILNVRRDNINVMRERLLKNIKKVDDFLDFLVEYGHLGNSILKIKKAHARIRSSHDLIHEEQLRLKEELEFIEKNINNITDHEQIKFYKSRLHDLAVRQSELKGELIDNERYLKSEADELDEMQELNDDYKKKIMTFEIDATAFLIDPTGKLNNYFKELILIYSDPENHQINRTKALELRRKINEIFNKKIMEILSTSQI